MREELYIGIWHILVFVYLLNLLMADGKEESINIVLLDCLQSCGVIKNDRQCMEIHARKLVDKKDPRVEFELEEIEFK